MIKTAYAVAIAAIAASVFVAFPSLSPQVGASAPVVGAKGDRADIRPLGSECGAYRSSSSPAVRKALPLPSAENPFRAS
jgi:hypothetical protein